MAGCCTVFIVRHGETDANVRHLLQGQGDYPLNGNGRLQGSAAAERLEGEDFSGIYSSDLIRAAETAEIIAARHPGVKVEKLPELREWKLGVLENRPQSELQKEYPELLQSFRKECPDACIPGGETLAEFHDRICKAVTGIADANGGKKVLIVTHGGVLQRIFRMAVGPTSGENYLSLSENASICIVRRDIEAGAWQLVAWNMTDHLRHLTLHATLVY